MNKIEYKLKTEIREPYNKEHINYGIEVYENGALIEYIPEVFEEKEYGEKLIRLCIENDVAPEHIRDIISDMVYDICHA